MFASLVLDCFIHAPVVVCFSQSHVVLVLVDFVPDIFCESLTLT